MSSIVSLTQLKHLLLVAESRNYGDAAARAFRSQAAISKSITSLESLLGGKLFESNDRTLLTAFGQSCLPYAREVIEAHERAVRSIAQLVDGSQGHVTLASIGSFANTVLPGVVERLSKERPALSLTFLDDNSENIAEMVRSSKADFGVACRISVDPELQFLPLISDRYGAICSREHRFAKQTEVAWSELESEKIVGAGVHRQLAHLPSYLHLSNAALQATNMMTLLSLVQAGLGITVMASLTIPQNWDGLVFVPLVQPIEMREIFLITAVDRVMSPAAQRVVSLIVDACSAGSVTTKWAGGLCIK